MSRTIRQRKALSNPSKQTPSRLELQEAMQAISAQSVAVRLQLRSLKGSAALVTCTAIAALSLSGLSAIKVAGNAERIKALEAVAVPPTVLYAPAEADADEEYSCMTDWECQLQHPDYID